MQILSDPARKGCIGKYKATIFINGEESYGGVISEINQLFALLTNGTVHRVTLRDIIHAPMHMSSTPRYGLCRDLKPALRVFIAGQVLVQLQSHNLADSTSLLSVYPYSAKFWLNKRSMIIRNIFFHHQLKYIHSSVHQSISMPCLLAAEILELIL